MNHSEGPWLRATKQEHCQMRGFRAIWHLLFFNPPHSDSIPHDSLCPWRQLGWFHRTPGMKFRQTNEANRSLFCLVQKKQPTAVSKELNFLYF